MSTWTDVDSHEVVNRWPHIRRFLRVESAGWVADDFHWWNWWVRGTLSPAELAAAYEQWAEFYQWTLTLRAEELAGDQVKRHIVEQWTDDMTYLCRRCAARARGEDPGEWVHSWQRRPDLAAAPARHLRKVG